MAIPKSIRGKRVEPQEWRHEILRLVDERVQASPGEIAEALGPEWTATPEKRQTVRVTMVHMKNQGWLLPLERGLYGVNPKWEQRLSRDLEGQIIDTIRTLGGLARARDILEDFDTRPAANKERGNDGRAGGAANRIFAEMKKSIRIIHYEIGAQQSRWGLTPDEMAKVPLTGAIAAYLINYNFLEAIQRRAIDGGQEAYDRVRENIDEHFNVVGMAFKRARTLYNAEIENVIEVEDIADALELMRLRNLPLVSRIHQDIRKDAAHRAKEEGREKDETYIELLYDQATAKFHAYILAYFEMGDPDTHKTAPLSLYTAYAEHFNLDAAALSRGAVIGYLKESAPSVANDEEVA